MPYLKRTQLRIVPTGSIVACYSAGASAQEEPDEALATAFAKNQKQIQ